MRVLWVSHRDIKHQRAGGAEKAIYEIGRRLASNGHSVTWYSVMDDRRVPEDIISNIKIKRHPNNVMAHVSLPLVLRREKPDVVVDDLGHAVPWGSEAFHVKGTVSFWHLHRRSLAGQVSMPKRILLSGLEALYPLIYRKFPFVTESESSKNDLVKLGIDESRVRVIPLGLNSEDFLNVPKSKSPTLVYFGGLRNYKRPWLSVNVLEEVVKKYPDSRLYVVGSGPSLERVKRRVIEKDLSRSVIFTGRLSERDLKQLVGSSWVNLHFSVTEGFGLSIIEASATGTPTVAFSVPGVSEAIVEERNGMLVKDGDISEFTKVVTGIINSYPDNLRSSAVAVAKRYWWDNTAKQWEKHLENILYGN